jgi:hypothetical protein
VDVLIDLLPSVNQVKIENAKKDKRQRNKYTRQMTSATSKQPLANNVEKGAAFKQIFWDGPERRSTADRRHLKGKRGRWLESRDRNDRRTTRLAISVKI